MDEHPDIHPATALRLGDPVDLWAGLRARFAGTDLPWHVPTGRPALTEPLAVPSTPPRWGEPILSFHDGAADLLGRLLGLRIEPMVALEGPLAMTARELLVEAPSHLTLASGAIVPLRPEGAYLLVRLDGLRGISHYSPEWLGLNRGIRILHWQSKAGRSAIARLRLSGSRRAGGRFHGDLTAHEARRYLSYFEAMGTHLVRSVSHGERLFQLFEVDRAFIPALRQAFADTGGTDELVGAAAFGMAHLTRPPWVTRIGPILSASGDRVPQAPASHAVWRSDRPDEPPSLLASRARLPTARAAALAPLAACSIVGVTFANQGLMLEDFRADAWTRVMRAGLCQRFPGLTLAGWEVRERFRPDIFLASAGLTRTEALSRTAAPSVPAFTFVLDLAKTQDVIDAGAGCFAFLAATDAQTGRAMDCRFAGPGFDPATWTIPFVEGAATFTDPNGMRWCLTDGLWLGGAVGARPAVVAAPTEPDIAALIHLAPTLAAHLQLIDRLRTPLVRPEVDTAMRRCAAWLARACTDSLPLAELKRHALQVAGDAAAEPADATGPPLVASFIRQCMDLLALPADAPELGARAHRLDRRPDLSFRGDETTAQLHRLIVLLSALDDCNRRGLSVETLDDLAPATFAKRFDGVLTGLSERGRRA